MTRRWPERLPLPDEVVAIARRLEEAGYETWCVGGALRDALLGHPRADVDLATQATPDEVRRLFRHTVAVGVRFGTVGVVDRRRVLHEVTTFRRDVTTDGRHAVVEYGASLDDDLARRDFTINAMAYHPLRQVWRDPFGGADDLERRIVRAVGHPGDRFREDYLRILRALRFAARLEFEIAPETWTALVAEAEGLRLLSAERVRDEWLESVATARRLPHLVSLWHESGAARVLLPELRPRPRLADPAPADRDAVLLTHVLCDDAPRVADRLRCSNAIVSRLVRLASAAPAPADPDSVESVRRWLASVGPAADDLLAVHRLEHGGPAPWADTVSGIRARGEPVSRAELAVTGDDLVAAGIQPGPGLGRILSALMDHVLADPGQNRRDLLLPRALELARRPDV